MMDKIVEYSVRFAVPQSKLSQHQKNFEALIHKLVNTNSSMKNTDIVSIKRLWDARDHNSHLGRYLPKEDGRDDLALFYFSKGANYATLTTTNSITSEDMIKMIINKIGTYKIILELKIIKLSWQRVKVESKLSGTGEGFRIN